MTGTPEPTLIEIALGNTTEAILVTDRDNRILFVNPTFTRITGYSPEEVLGKNPSLMRSGRHGHHFFTEMWQSLEQDGRWQGEIWNRRKNGELFPAWLTINAVRNEKGQLTHYAGSMVDIKDQKIREIALRRRTQEDPVTGLLNRRAFYDRMMLALRRTERAGNILVALFIRFPRMEEFRDSFGETMMEETLRAIATRLSTALRAGEDVSRQGDRHFAVCLGDLSSLEHAARVAQRITQVFEKPIQAGGHTFFMPPKIGVSLFPSDGKEPDILLSKAETAARLAQEEGEESFRFFIPAMHDRALARFKLENDMKLAIEREEFTLHFQPKCNLRTGRIGGAEALIRWRPGGGDLVSPATFIPVAEETELILPMGEWVLRTACHAARAWDLWELEVAVNLSAHQFRDSAHLGDLVESALAESGLPPSRLKLELTESKQMDYDKVYTILNRLSGMGVALAMDDFGTGYSNFSYLSAFPLKELKLDRSYIQRIGHPREFKMISSILSMARGVGFSVVGEGVEDRREVSCLAALGCSEIQGFCLSPPLPPESLGEFLTNHRPEEWQFL